MKICKKGVTQIYLLHTFASMLGTCVLKMIRHYSTRLSRLEVKTHVL